MRPATILTIGFVLLLGFGLCVLLLDSGDQARPPGRGPDGHEVRPLPAPPPAIEREAAGRAREPAPEVGSTPTPIEPPRSEPADTTANVRLRVRTVANHADVAAFTWRFRGDATSLHGDGTSGHALLRLPPGTAGRLLIEAAGLAPFVRSLTVPAVGEPEVPVDAFLAVAGQATGITLMVHDTALQPITHVRVDAFLRQPGDRDGAWHLGAALWARRTAASDGRYVLPELAPGDYGIRVLATDADGELLPLLPYLHTFALTGSSGYVEDVTLEPACVPEFELFDAAGMALDPAKVGVVQLQLHLPGAPAVPRMWTMTTDGRTTTALDTLPGRGAVAVAQPVAAGTYVLVVAIADQPRVEQFVTLRAGERQHERIVVP